jgi:hypothetical protein
VLLEVRQLARAAAVAGHQAARARRQPPSRRTRRSAALVALVRPLGGGTSDEKVTNRDIKVWHFVIENGY